jgi:NodT family efflux transporter outer membrane factor (OMF) lipoprotein
MLSVNCKMSLQRSICLLAVSVLVLTSCSPLLPAAPPDAPGVLPDTYSLYTGEVNASEPWWTALNSPELNRLIGMAFDGSFTLKAAYARFRQADWLAVQAGAARFPELNATGSADAIRRRTASPAQTRGQQTVSLGLAGSYELDLWGGVRSTVEAARLDAAASRADLATAMASMAGEVADRWVQIVSQHLQRKLLERQLEANLTYLELIELRFKNAMVSALDVYQQRQVVEGVRAKLPLVDANIQLLEHELAALVGRMPGTALGLTQEHMPVIDDLPALGLPADLLANRPDVRAAGMRLYAARWQVAAARADRLPSLAIGAAAQYGASELDLLFDTWLLNLAANLTAPIFDGGRRAAAEKRARAEMDENLWTYRQMVLTAVREVEDALARESRQRAYISGLESVMAAARSGFEEASQRYRRGLSDYLPVLTQLIAVQDLERNLIVQRETLIRYRIGVYRALGGRWSGGDMPNPDIPTAASRPDEQG